MIITKRKFYSRLSTVLFLLGTLFIIAIYAYLLSKSPQVQATGNYQNAELADHALTFVGQHASKACRGVPTIANGECKTFVNCIVYAVSGRTQRTYPGYHEGFRNAGGVSVNRSDTVRGDIIQVGNSDLERPLHTAIVLHRNGDGSFRVVDSNSHGRIIEGVWVGDGIVRERKTTIRLQMLASGAWAKRSVLLLAVLI